MGTTGEVRQLLVLASRRHSRVREEAEDVAHDIIVAALRRGLPLEDEGFARTIDASARRHAAFVARGAARRRAREVRFALEPAGGELGETNLPEGVAPAALPSALRTTLLLLSLGHTKSELRSALGLSDATLRKRIQGLRERAPLARPEFTERAVFFPQVRRTQVGLVLRLASSLEGRGRMVAASDCDGHGIIFAEVLTNERATATTQRRPRNFPG
jgi:DNA-directed RNA polymerase specialized sigma24 family protein